MCLLIFTIVFGNIFAIFLIVIYTPFHPILRNPHYSCEGYYKDLLESGKLSLSGLQSLCSTEELAKKLAVLLVVVNVLQVLAVILYSVFVYRCLVRWRVITQLPEKQHFSVVKVNFFVVELDESKEKADVPITTPKETKKEPIETENTN